MMLYVLRLSILAFVALCTFVPTGAQAKSKAPNLTHKMGSEAGLNEELQNEIELELTQLSLTKQTSLSAAIKDAADRLSPDEMAELMLAYAEHFSRMRPNSVKLAPRAASGR